MAAALDTDEAHAAAHNDGASAQAGVQARVALDDALNCVEAEAAAATDVERGEAVQLLCDEPHGVVGQAPEAVQPEGRQRLAALRERADGLVAGEDASAEVDGAEVGAAPREALDPKVGDLAAPSEVDLPQVAAVDGEGHQRGVHQQAAAAEVDRGEPPAGLGEADKSAVGHPGARGHVEALERRAVRRDAVEGLVREVAPGKADRPEVGAVGSDEAAEAVVSEGRVPGDVDPFEPPEDGARPSDGGVDLLAALVAP
mmetsp:Transcript_27909/g.66298  ORF Transcript_27909/g.66298 Transcript_27909/m.66298 type:complete len:257 (+) Transcript_27909:324-1094(+)